jgi:uncharacterized glyoxalase superfamily protein PhnB
MSKKAHPTVIPTLRYRDAAAAIDWLCRAFGFERHLVVPGERGVIDHAQLTCGHGMIMLGSALDDDFGKLQKPAADVGGVSTQSSYIVVPDADAHCERATAAGAKIVIDLADASYGGRGYSCLDVEGHLWHFGSYDPWADA